MTLLAHPLLLQYRQLAEALSATFGPCLECAVYDYREQQHSVFAIVNGHISGRKAGDTIGELPELSSPDLLANPMLGFPGRSAQGTPLKSSTIAIRDEQDVLIGALNLNLDLAAFQSVQILLDALTRCQTLQRAAASESEIRHLGGEQRLRRRISTLRHERGLAQQKLKPKDRRALIAALRNEGLLGQRHAMEIVAQELQVSRASAYNALRSLAAD